MPQATLPSWRLLTLRVAAAGVTRLQPPSFIRYSARNRHHLLLNDPHSTRSSCAAHGVRGNFFLMCGRTTSGSVLRPLVCGARAFSTFHGGPNDFSRLLHSGPVVAFFYKPAGGPYAALCGRLREMKDKWRAPAAPSGPSPAAASAATAAAASPAPGSTAARDSVDCVPEAERELCELLKQQFLREYGAVAAGVHFLAIDTNENPRLTALHDVRSLPTFVAYYDGKMVARAEGAHETELVTMMSKLGEASTAAADENTATNSTASKNAED